MLPREPMGENMLGILRREIAMNTVHSESQKAPIIGAKFAENLPIMSKHWVILKENGHFVPRVKVTFPKKVPIIGAEMLKKQTFS